MKSNKWEVAVATLLCLLPILAGVLVYDRLPEQIATHFGLSGEPDGWSSRAFTVFGLPAIMAAASLLVNFGLRTDPKKQNMSGALRAITIWSIPALSVVLYALTIGNALGYSTHIELIVPIIVGVLLVVIGNYLPKTKQSYTMGIRLPWTLASEENWNRTHRLAGFVWVLGGAALALCALLGIETAWLMLLVFALLVLIPTVYSYCLHRKGI